VEIPHNREKDYKEDNRGIQVDHWCWGPSSSEGPKKHDLTMFLEYNT
jgi:hypothetical protein